MIYPSYLFFCVIVNRFLIRSSGKVKQKNKTHFTGEWEVVPGSGPGRQLGPDEAEWRWNSITQNWERTMVSGESGASGGE